MLSTDNPQVQGIIVALSKDGSDKYGVSNPQGAKGKIMSCPICDPIQKELEGPTKDRPAY